MIDPIDIESAFARVKDLWSPLVIGQVNDQYIKIARVRGEFVWHAHDDEDEMFFVVRGTLRISLEDGELTLNAGQCAVIPRGVRHRPMADEECWVMLVEPVATKHTGNVTTPLTRSIAEQLGR